MRNNVQFLYTMYGVQNKLVFIYFLYTKMFVCGGGVELMTCYRDKRYAAIVRHFN
jgi:hypothetical protein